MILLDTCGLLALQDGGGALSTATRVLLEAPGSEAFISAISAFEIGQKHTSGKLILTLNLPYGSRPCFATIKSANFLSPRP